MSASPQVIVPEPASDAMRGYRGEWKQIHVPVAHRECRHQESEGRRVSHTPGPWSVEAIYALLRFGRKSGGSWDDIGEEHEFFPDEDDANLIAAAPEMLAVLEELRESSTCCGTYDLLDETTWASPDLADRIEAAIRKARGEK